MKALPGIVTRLGVVFALLIVAACNIQNEADRSARIGTGYVTIHPRAMMTGDDCDALVNALSKFDKHIYRIQNFKNGKPDGDPIGELSDREMESGLVKAVTNEAAAARPPFSGCAIQVGRAGSSTRKSWEIRSGSSTRPTPTPHLNSGSSTHPTPAPSGTSSTHKSTQESDRMLEELKPILARYNTK